MADDDIQLNLSYAAARPRVLGTLKQCMYCGSETSQRGNEHIIPSSLNGRLILRNASCEPCQRITSSFERDLARKTFHPMRVRFGLKTYHKDRQPASFALNFTFADGSRRTEMVSAHEFPTSLVFPVFTPPSFLADTPSVGDRLLHHLEIRLDDDPAIDALLRKHGAVRAEATTLSTPASMARLVAKVAYGMVIARPELKLARPFVLPLILGQSADVTRYVGNLDSERPAVRRSLHQVRILEINGHAVAFVQLFAAFGAPEYTVIVGALTHH